MQQNACYFGVILIIPTLFTGFLTSSLVFPIHCMLEGIWWSNRWSLRNGKMIAWKTSQMGTPQCELEMEVTYMDLHEKAESQECVSSFKKCSFGNYSFEAKLYHQHLKVLISQVGSPNLRSLSPSHTSQDMKQALHQKSLIRFGAHHIKISRHPISGNPSLLFPSSKPPTCRPSSTNSSMVVFKVQVSTLSVDEKKSPGEIPMGVSKNRGTPKWMVYKWKPY